MEKVKLMAKSLNMKKGSEVLYIDRDGWVVTRDGAYGDNGEDCETYIELDLKAIRKAAKFTQEEMSWIMGCSRTAYLSKEQGLTGLKLNEYFCLLKTKELNQLLINNTI